MLRIFKKYEFIPPSVGGIEWLRPLLFKGEQIAAGAEHSRAVGAYWPNMHFFSVR